MVQALHWHRSAALVLILDGSESAGQGCATGRQTHRQALRVAIVTHLLWQISFPCHSFGQLTADYQSHSGAVNTGTSPKVQHEYASGSATASQTGTSNCRQTVAANFSSQATSEACRFF